MSWSVLSSPRARSPGIPAPGSDTLERLVRTVAPTPVYAIGGLTPERVVSVLAAGAHGVAVRSAILSARDPRRAARAFADALSAV